MKTQIKYRSKARLVYLSIQGMALLAFIIGIIALFTPTSVLNAIYDFEQHHLILFCFISLLAFMLFLKLHLSIVKAEGKLKIKMLHFKKLMLQKDDSTPLSEDPLIYNDEKKSELINKKDVRILKFDDRDALLSNELKKIRERDLKKAMILGNSYKHKVKLFFRDCNSFKHVETTVWCVDEKYVSLKAGILIPKKSIYKIAV